MQKITEGIYLIDSNMTGNTTTIMVGVHGNEVSGIDALDEIIKDIEIISGKVYFLYANLEAIKQNVRFTESNLNRCFLKEQNGNTYEEIRAKEIMKILDNSDFLLDIHNTLSFNSSLEILITIHTDYAKYFPLNNIITHIDNAQEGGSDGYMDLIGKKGFCIECGSINFGDTEKSKKIANDSIINFLKLTGNIYGKPEIYNLQNEIMKMDYVYKTKTNDFKLKREFRDFELLKSGEIIGYDGDEEIKTIKESIIIFAHEMTIKEKGKEAFYIGYKV